MKPVHSGFTQYHRDIVVTLFRQGDLKLLIAADVVARGLDFHGITHIINSDISLDPLAYFHRIDRTARMEQ